MFDDIDEWTIEYAMFDDIDQLWTIAAPFPNIGNVWLLAAPPWLKQMIMIGATGALMMGLYPLLRSLPSQWMSAPRPGETLDV